MYEYGSACFMFKENNVYVFLGISLAITRFRLRKKMANYIEILTLFHQIFRQCYVI